MKISGVLANIYVLCKVPVSSWLLHTLLLSLFQEQHVQWQYGQLETEPVTVYCMLSHLGLLIAYVIVIKLKC